MVRFVRMMDWVAGAMLALAIGLQLLGTHTYVCYLLRNFHDAISVAQLSASVLSVAWYAVKYGFVLWRNRHRIARHLRTVIRDDSKRFKKNASIPALAGQRPPRPRRARRPLAPEVQRKPQPRRTRRPPAPEVPAAGTQMGTPAPSGPQPASDDGS